MNNQEDGYLIMARKLNNSVKSLWRLPDRENDEDTVLLFARALKRRRVDRIGVKRIMYWIEEYDSKFPPAIPEMIAWTRNETPEEEDERNRQVFIEQQKRSALPRPADKKGNCEAKQQFMKAFAELIEEKTA